MTASDLVARELSTGKTSLTLVDCWNLAAMLWWSRHQRTLEEVLVDRLLGVEGPSCCEDKP